MRKYIITLIIVLVSFPSTEGADDSVDALERDKSILRTTFKEPLQVELLKKGLTPRNAAIASQHVLDNLIECWTSERNVPAGTEERTIVVQLGGKAIVTHASPCIDDFLQTVGEIAR